MNTEVRNIENAIMEKFPDAVIYKIVQTRFGIRVLGVIPPGSEFDEKHIVEWTGEGFASECRVSERDHREIGWDEEENKPVYLSAKTLIPNERFYVSVSCNTAKI